MPGVLRGRIPLARRGLPPSHIFAMALRDQLTSRSGQLHGAAEVKAKVKEVEALAEDFADNESEKQALALKCMPPDARNGRSVQDGPAGG